MKTNHAKSILKNREDPAALPLKQPMRIFVVQHHLASHDHYDFRLQFRGVLVSWAIPKGPSFNPKDKRLAILVENHPLSYADFEGTIPSGSYGAGCVQLWDTGTWTGLNFAKGFQNGTLVFTLYGQRLKGTWSLSQFGNLKTNWLLVKQKDAFSKNSCGITTFKTSVKTGRTMTEIFNAGKSENKK